MNLLKTIIERLNQRVEVANIFDKQFNLCELNANGNDKAWVHYIGNGQAEVVTNFDAKNGTLFWAKRGKVSVAKTDAYKMSGCKQLYVTTFPLTAYAIVRKSHLPCDAEDAQDWLASRVYKLTSGTDPLFKQSIGVINYEVVPSGYTNEIKTLTANYEWACVSVDMDVQVITTSEDGCYDTCATGDIPLPDLQPCTPCLTEVAVDGITITGDGTPANPLVAVGGGGGAISVEDEGDEVTPIATTLNFTGAGVTASLTSPGVVEVNIPGGTGDVGTLQEVTDVGNTTTNDIIVQGANDFFGQVSSQVITAYNNVTGAYVEMFVNTSGQLTLSDGTSAGILSVNNLVNTNVQLEFPNKATGNYTIATTADIVNQVNSDWNATTGVEEILNKPTIPAAQIQSDWNQTNNALLDYIKNKPTITNGTITSVNSGININVDNTNPAAPIINSLADRYKTSSVTSNSISNGSKSFAVDINLSYIPLQEILVVYNPANHMHGEVTSYDATTGALVVDIKTHTGSGTYTSWVLNLDGTPVDALTGSGTANEIAYFTAARVLASLPVATYPSLTELSYVKGVTSAIQTQINGKQDALVSGTNIKTINSTSLLGSGNITIASLGVYKNTTDGATSSATANTFSQSVLVPANSVVAGNILEFKLRGRKTGTAGLYTIRLYANTTNNLSGTPILLATYSGGLQQALGQQLNRTAAIKNATTNTEMFLATTSLATDFTNNVISSISVDWTSAQYIIGAVQCVSALDSSLISLISMTII